MKQFSSVPLPTVSMPSNIVLCYQQCPRYTVWQHNYTLKMEVIFRGLTEVIGHIGHKGPGLSTHMDTMNPILESPVVILRECC